MSKKDYEKSAEAFNAPQYDSDEDLTPEQRAKIKEQENRFNYGGADTLRDQAWNQAGTYPKLKRLVKDVWSGDIRKKKSD